MGLVVCSTNRSRCVCRLLHSLTLVTAKQLGPGDLYQAFAAAVA